MVPLVNDVHTFFTSWGGKLSSTSGDRLAYEIYHGGKKRIVDTAFIGDSTLVVRFLVREQLSIHGERRLNGCEVTENLKGKVIEVGPNVIMLYQMKVPPDDVDGALNWLMKQSTAEVETLEHVIDYENFDDAPDVYVHH